MVSDAMFDDSTGHEQLEEWLVRSREALSDARTVLELFDEDAATKRDRDALVGALSAVAGARRSLRRLDADLLADAENLLQQALIRATDPRPVALQETA